MKSRRRRIPPGLWLCALGSLTSSGNAADAPSAPSLLLLNGNTGKPMPGVALFLNPVCDTSCVYPKGPWRATADAAGRMPIPEVANMRAVQVMAATTDYLYCQDSSKHHLRPINPDRFDWDAIRRAGVTALNRCNTHVQSAAIPGQLIFFLRPLSAWERLIKPPAM